MKGKISNPEAYNHRDVMDLKPLSAWNPEEENIEIQQNRILQPGFLNRPALEVIEDAKKAHVDWLTDYCCPSAQASIFLNVAKEMVVTYKVNDTELNVEAQKSFHKMIENNPNIITRINSETDRSLQEFLRDKNIADEAIAHLDKVKATKSPDAIEATERMLVDKYRKDIINGVSNIIVKEELRKVEQELHLGRKDTHALGQTTDFSMLGAAGSGKSTILNQFLAESEKPNYVTIATDNYRAFTLPGTEAHEARPTQDVFVRSQDLAYMVKELVQNEMKQKLDGRPNIIFDGITLERDTRDLFSQGGEVKSIIAAFVGNNP